MGLVRKCRTCLTHPRAFSSQLAQQACIDQARRAVLAEQAAVERLKKREASAASVAAACMPSQAACLPTQSAVARRRKRQLGSKKSTVGGTRMKAVVVSGDGEGSKARGFDVVRRGRYLSTRPAGTLLQAQASTSPDTCALL